MMPRSFWFSPSKPVRELLLACALLAAAAEARAETLRGQLQQLAQQNNIKLEGLDQLGAEPAEQVSGDLAQRIKTLLADYNFMLIGTASRIESISITSPKQHTARPRIEGAVQTQRLGAHHQVKASLVGPNNIEITTSLLVDTGATALVLPESMIAALGFNLQAMQTGSSQTAAGKVAVKTGLLKSVNVGGVVAENVPVSFINDQQLGGSRLLGMSFLNRFRFSLDDTKNELLLLSK